MRTQSIPRPNKVTRAWHGLLAAVLSLPLAMSASPMAFADVPDGPQAVPPVRQLDADGDQQQTHRVTLVTGDVVTYSERAGGQSAVSIEAAARSGPPPVFETRTGPDGYYVIPSDAEPYLASGAVDPELFDVKGLAEEGLADTSTDKVPVIVSYGENTPAEVVTRLADDLPASDRTVSLSSIDAAAVRVNRAEANVFWRAVAGDAPGEGAGVQALGGGVRKLRLDRKVKASLDQSVPRIGAPEAWKAGLDGSGVTVAVLDTGIDARHPDLAGRIGDSRNFTEDPDTSDGFGHGTHVASIIAGSGAASGGRYRGVASRVKLLNGKVLDSTGSGEESQLMAGMEWAAKAGARVVNMSLGGGPSDGSDPLSEMVNKLTAETGALFVVAAGNSGEIASVETPASAGAALAVGAVDKSDRVAGFSSRGPRSADAAVKPEIVAPGVDIAAARAAGTSLGVPVGEHYTRLSGTSMATPHVAAAAALLAQKHPQWRSTELKEVLTSSAKDIGAEWFEEGAGRVDIPSALASEVLAPSSISLGRLSYPAGQVRTDRPVTYTNVTDRDVTLSLKLSATLWNGKQAPAGVARLDKDTVVVPAKRQATVTVTIDPTVGPPGAYGGLITATGQGGGPTARTPIGFYDEPETVPLTVKLTDSRGKAPAPRALTIIRDDYDWVNPRNNDPFLPPVFSTVVTGGTGTVRVPSGKYSTTATVVEQGADIRRATLLAAAEVPVNGPSTIALDARTAVLMQVKTKDPTDTRERFTAVQRLLPGAPLAFASGVLTSGPGWQINITPSAAAGRGTVASQDHLTLGQALVDLKVRTPAGGQALHPVYDSAGIAGKLAGERELQVISAEPGNSPDFGVGKVKDKVALLRIAIPAETVDPVIYARQAVRDAATRAREAGAVAILPYVDVRDALPITGLTGDPLPQLALSQQEGDQLGQLAKQGDVMISLSGRTQPDFMYNLYFRDRNGVRAPHVNTVDPAKLVAVDTRYHGDKPDIVFNKKWFALPTDSPSSIALSGTQFRGPSQWTEYIGPVDDKVQWKRYVSQMAPNKDGQPDRSTTFSLFSEDVFAKAGQRPQERWFQAPIHGGAATHTEGGLPLLCSLCRGDTGEFLPAAQWMDSTRGHFVEPWQSGAYLSKVRMRQGGREIPGMVRDLLPAPLFQLGMAAGTYRLDVDDTLPDEPVFGWPNRAVQRLTPRVTTAVTFNSAPPAGLPPPGYGCLAGWAKCAYQPIIGADYQLGLDLLNQAPAGRTHAFHVAVGHHEAAESAGEITEFRLWYSINDGSNWAPAEVVPTGNGHYTVRIPHPTLGETTGFVSLRAEAWDNAGNRMTQTMQRAYALTDKPAR